MYRQSAFPLPHFPLHSHLLVGLSGGVDSVVLLHWLYQLAPRFNWTISALHVHHGISPHADAWENFCTTLCLNYQITLKIERVHVASLRATDGLEAAARQLRHAAFAQQPCDFVVLAHHADDQVETLLLQLLRGAGVRGAAAMGERGKEGDAPGLARPLLQVSRAEILRYAAAQQLRWVEDESNADEYYPRNFLRHSLLPTLAEKFPAYRQTLTRSAQHFAEAAELLDELAQQDLGDATTTLPVARLQALRPARAKNLLRYFLDQHGAPMPPAARLTDLLHQLCTARADAAVCVEYGGWQVRRYQQQVYVLPIFPPLQRDFMLPWQGENALNWLPLNTRLRFELNASQLTLHAPPLKSTSPIDLAALPAEPFSLRLRQGGETLRAHTSTRTLKNLLQEQHVPPWQRQRLPLLYCGEKLIAVFGVAVNLAA